MSQIEAFHEMQKTFHVVTGLPRAGSTLLCNILNQNPEFYASSTSYVSRHLHSLKLGFSTYPEAISDLAHDREEAERRTIGGYQGFVDGVYGQYDKRVIFDKSRGWSLQSVFMQSAFPGSKMLVCVRNLLDVAASIERQHRRTGLFDGNPSPTQQTHMARMNQAFLLDPQKGSLVGTPLIGIQDLMRTRAKDVKFVRYETLAAHPEEEMKNIYAFLGEKWFEHDFDNVENVATDLDAQYLHKFPHEGHGKVTPSTIEWSDWVAQDVAIGIRQQHAWFQNRFAYT